MVKGAKLSLHRFPRQVSKFFIGNGFRKDAGSNRQVHVHEAGSPRTQREGGTGQKRFRAR
jgi:hypothetical protein